MFRRFLALAALPTLCLAACAGSNSTEEADRSIIDDYDRQSREDEEALKASAASEGEAGYRETTDTELVARLSDSIGAITWRDSNTGKVQGCIATLVTPDQIVTARHCLQNFVANSGDLRFSILSTDAPMAADALLENGFPLDELTIRLGAHTDIGVLSAPPSLRQSLTPLPVEPGWIVQGAGENAPQPLTMPWMDIEASEGVMLRFTSCDIAPIDALTVTFSHRCREQNSTSGSPVIAVRGPDVGLVGVHVGFRKNRLRADGEEDRQRYAEFDAISLAGACGIDATVRGMLAEAVAEINGDASCIAAVPARGNGTAFTLISGGEGGRSRAVTLGPSVDPVAQSITGSPARLAEVMRDGGVIQRLSFLPDAPNRLGGRMLAGDHDGGIFGIRFSAVQGRTSDADSIVARDGDLTCRRLYDFTYSGPANALVVACIDGVFAMRPPAGASDASAPLNQWRSLPHGALSAVAVAAHPALPILAVGNRHCGVALAVIGDEIQFGEVTNLPAGACDNNDKYVTGLAFSPQGDRLIATTYYRTCILAVENENLRLLNCEPPPPPVRDVRLRRPLFVPGPEDRSTLVMAASGRAPHMMPWPSPPPATAALSTLPAPDIFSVATSNTRDISAPPDGESIVAATSNGHVVVWSRDGDGFSPDVWIENRGVQIRAALAMPSEAIDQNSCEQRGQTDVRDLVAFATYPGEIFTAYILPPGAEEACVTK